MATAVGAQGGDGSASAGGGGGGGGAAPAEAPPGKRGGRPPTGPPGRTSAAPPVRPDMSYAAALPTSLARHRWIANTVRGVVSAAGLLLVTLHFRSDAESRTYGSLLLGLTTSVAPLAYVVVHLISGFVFVPGQKKLHQLLDYVMSINFVRRRVGSLANFIHTLLTAYPFWRKSLVQALHDRGIGCNRLKVTTGDHNVLDGMVLSYYNVTPGSQPTAMIILNGNGQLYEGLLVPSLAEFAKRVDYLIIFNYRGVGDSTGTCSRWGLVVDGCSMAQFAMQGLGVPMNRLILHGHSLGGGIAAQVAAMYPDVRLCSDRSFGSLAEVAPYHVLPESVMTAAEPQVEHQPPTCSRSFRVFARVLSTAVILAVRYGIQWDLHTLSKWNTVRGYRWVLYEPTDVVIPYYSQLNTRLEDQGDTTTPRVQLAVVDGGGGAYGHNRELTPLEMAEQLVHIDRALRAK